MHAAVHDPWGMAMASRLTKQVRGFRVEELTHLACIRLEVYMGTGWHGCIRKQSRIVGQTQGITPSVWD